MEHICDIKGAVENPFVIGGIRGREEVVSDLFSVDACFKIAESCKIKHGTPDFLFRTERAAQVRRGKCLVAAKAEMTGNPYAGKRNPAFARIKIFCHAGKKFSFRPYREGKIVSCHRQKRIACITYIRAFFRGDKACVPDGGGKIGRGRNNNPIGILPFAVFVRDKFPRELGNTIDNRTDKTVDSDRVFTYFHGLFPFLVLANAFSEIMTRFEPAVNCFFKPSLFFQKFPVFFRVNGIKFGIRAGEMSLVDKKILLYYNENI